MRAIPTHRLGGVDVDRAGDRPITRRPGFRSRERFDFGGRHRPGGEPFGALVVFNEDHVEDGVGIPMHPHVGVEVMSLMLAGRMHHVDSLGNDIEVGPHDVKVMHTGGGLLHGGTCLGGTRFLQIWIVADAGADRTPAVEVATRDPSGRRDRWQRIAAPIPGGDTICLRQTAWVDRGTFAAGSSVELPQRVDDAASYVYVVDGTATIDGATVSAGDTISLTGDAGPLDASTGVDLVVITQPAAEVGR